MYHSTDQIKTASWWPFSSKKEPNEIIPDAKRENYGFVYPKDLDDSYKYLGYAGDLALAGIGAGLSWHALKKFVEHTYRKRLEKAVRNSTGVKDFYTSRTAPITNTYVGATKEGSVNKEGLWYHPNLGLWPKQIEEAYKSPNIKENHGDDVELVGVPRNNGFLNSVATRMAENPLLYNTLAFVSLPAILAGSVWAGNGISKKINDFVKPKDIRRMTKERDEARKRYEDAALTLRNITNGDMPKKEASLEKDAGLATILTLGGLGLLGAGGLGAAFAAGERPNPKDPKVVVPNPYPSDNSTANMLLSAGIGTLGLAAIPASYQFVQSMRKGYKNRVEGISDVTRAAQAWDAVRDARGEDFATLRASLAEEPDLLDYKAHGLKKRRK